MELTHNQEVGGSTRRTHCSGLPTGLMFPAYASEELWSIDNSGTGKEHEVTKIPYVFIEIY